MGFFKKDKDKDKDEGEDVIKEHEGDLILAPPKSKEEKKKEKEKASANEDTIDEEDAIKAKINNQIEVIKNASTVDTASKGMTMKPEFWGPLWEYINNPDITDVDYNGKELWLRNSNGDHFLAEHQEGLTQDFINALTQRIANEVSKPFNPMNPLLEAETKELRISVIHEAVVPNTGRSFCIRKTPTFARISTKSAIDEEYADMETLSFLVNCVRAHMNIAVCGEPGVGKTEFTKYLSSFIPDNERVITIEDSLEWHYPSIHPNADTIEMQVKPDTFNYFAAIKACLRQNPKWIMLSEARGEEVIAYIQQLSTGVNGLTTLHCDNTRKIPDRFLNMCTTGQNKERMENDIYSFLNIGIYLNRHKDSHGNECRFIDQISCFGILSVEEMEKMRAEEVAETGNKINRYLWNNGKKQFDTQDDLVKLLPKETWAKFKKRGVTDLLHNAAVEEAYKEGR